LRLGLECTGSELLAIFDIVKIKFMIDINLKKSEIEKLAEKHKIKFIVLFGSRAKGVFREDSDFDVAVYMDGFNDMNIYNAALFGLGEILDIPAEKIDLTNLKNANPLLRYEIAREGKLLFGNEMSYLEFKAFAFRDYIAAKSLLDLEYFLIKKRHKLLEKYVK